MFVLGIFGVDLLKEFSKLLPIERARFALEHDAAKIAPRFAVFIEDDGYVGIAFNVTDFPCASLRTEVDLVLVEQRTHRDIMRDTVWGDCRDARNTQALCEVFLLRCKFHASSDRNSISGGIVHQAADRHAARVSIIIRCKISFGLDTDNPIMRFIGFVRELP